MVKRFNPDKRRRPKVDDYFGDWKWREALAETMVPLVGKLYRNGISILMYGRPLLNCSAVEIMKLHRFVREVEGNELSEIETFPVLESIAKMKLLPCEIDLGEIVSHLLENENLDPEKYVEKPFQRIYEQRDHILLDLRTLYYLVLKKKNSNKTSDSRYLEEPNGV